jgi:hypothetical protein
VLFVLVRGATRAEVGLPGNCWHPHAPGKWRKTVGIGGTPVVTNEGRNLKTKGITTALEVGRDKASERASSRVGAGRTMDWIADAYRWKYWDSRHRLADNKHPKLEALTLTAFLLTNPV